MSKPFASDYAGTEDPASLESDVNSRAVEINSTAFVHNLESKHQHQQQHQQQWPPSINEGTQDDSGRQAWGGKAEFLLSCLSYSVGLGNVWRFPYLCYENGGGAFLFPFACMLFLVGIPLVYLETCFGQYSATGPITVWRLCPLFSGLGWSMIIVSFIGGVYYNVLVSWTLLYFWKSATAFGSELPWTTCSAEWNTGDCMHIRLLSQRNRCQQQGGFFSLDHNGTCLLSGNSSWQLRDGESPPALIDNSSDGYAYSALYETARELNSTNASQLLAKFLGDVPDPKTSGDEYFHNFVLSISNGFHDLGLPKWELVLCLLAVWAITGLCLIRGVKSAGKAVYFTSLFPYFVLTGLLVRGLTLEGSAKGLAYFFIPKWERLADPTVWGKAAIQVFFSLSSGWGGIIALSSYNKFKNNAMLDSFIVSIGDGLTSVYSGMTVFCVLGYMSHVLSVPIDKVATGGAGLAFILYPDIVTSMPLSPLWSTLFFGMLLTLGFGTMISTVNTLKTAVCDYWRGLFYTSGRQLIVLAVICCSAFLLGLPCTTRGGMFVLQLLDNYCCTYTVLFISLTELLVITWIYGVDRFMENVAEMRDGRKLPAAWKYIWKFLSPLVIIVVAVFTFASVKPSKYGLYTFPAAADAIGGVIAFCVILPIPSVIVLKLCRYKAQQTLLQKLKDLCKPHRLWGREMGRRPAGYSPPGDPAAAFESQMTATSSYFLSASVIDHSTNSTAQHRI